MIFINFANENIADMKTRKVLSLIAFAFMTVALGACSDDNDYYYSPLIG